MSVPGEIPVVADDLILGLARAAKEASRRLAVLSRETKDAALRAMARALAGERKRVAAANAGDVARAEAAGLAAPRVRRLRLDASGIASICEALEQIASLPDPVGEVVERYRNARNGLDVARVRVPLGVVAMIYESRPNVTPEAAALCLKSGNAAILRGGAEALETNRALAEILRGAAAGAGVPSDFLQLVPRADRDDVRRIVSLDGLIDLAIPRGGEGLIRAVTEHARVPILRHDRGVCHVYVDEAADLDMARRIVVDGKTSNPATCNATECVLVHRRVADAFLPALEADLAKAGVKVRRDEDAFGKEFLDLILALRVVGSVDQALDHIARYGSRHTEAIVTRDDATAARFLQEVDASCVLRNASTRLNDGGCLGLGAEIGISTSKLHAYGPMGLRELTTKKYVVQGEGTLRAPAT
jgi:glutamate-5-semialdehyde dehydrogenase